jgi:hypothetical protein
MSTTKTLITFFNSLYRVILSSISDGPNWTDTDGRWVYAFRTYMVVVLGFCTWWCMPMISHAMQISPCPCVWGHVLVPPSGGETDGTGPSTTGSTQETRARGHHTVRSPIAHPVGVGHTVSTSCDILYVRARDTCTNSSHALHHISSALFLRRNFDGSVTKTCL